MKRFLDVVVSGIGLLLCLPILLLIALVVRLSGPGPVIFRQERVGRGGEGFIILKFRTMRASVGGPSVTSSGDARITTVGKFLRDTKIDELPQLLNVLRGDMSLVGPRPEVPEYVALWSPAVREVVLSVRPGITDPASLHYRRESEELAAAADPEQHYVNVVMPRKLAMYQTYVMTRSLRGDMRLVGQTLASVVRD